MIILKETDTFKVYFVSDTHFSHKNILKYDNRPFNDVNHHDETIINNWNSVVNSNDYVFHLGDVAFGKSNHALSILNRLNGIKFLVKGNHDNNILNDYNCRKHFRDIFPYLEVTLNNVDIVCFHYPIHEWNKCHRGTWHLHGHTHGKDTYDSSFKIMNVGINLINYTPIGFKDIKTYMDSKEVKTHH